MKIRKQPFDIDFLGNHPEYILLATPYSADGRKYQRVFTINALPAGSLIMEIDGETLTWQLSSTPTDSLWSLPSVADTDAQHLYDALGKFIYNPDVNRNFALNLSISNGVLSLKVTARQPGPHTVSLTHSGSTLYITPQTPVTGIDCVPRDDYRAMAFFEVITAKGTYSTPAMYYEESDGDVHVGCDIVSAWFGKPDVANPDEFFTSVPCKHATLKAQLFFGEMYAENGDSTALKTMAQGKRITLVNGKLDDYAYQSNMPDWNTADNTHFHLKTGVAIFGHDEGDTMLCPTGMEQYIYVYNYSASNVTARLIEGVTFADGSADADWNDENVTLVPGLNRITVKESDADVVKWKVTILNLGSNDTIDVRTFVVKPYDHGYHTFMLLNAMNLYETFVVEDLSREEESDGERRIIAGRDSYGTTDKQTIYTAKCHPRNANGLKLLRTAFSKQDNLLQDGIHAWYLDMIPGSLVVSDESADIIEAEFKFRLREKISRKPQVISTTSEDFEAAQVVQADTVFK